MNLKDLVAFQRDPDRVLCKFNGPDNFQDPLMINKITRLNLRKFLYTYHSFKDIKIYGSSFPSAAKFR